MRRWFLSFGALVLMAGIVAAVAASYQERWVKERVYWLIDVRGYVLTETRERALKPKDTFKECTNCPEMVVVPAGEFMMGWPDTEKSYSDNEGPQHKVMISRPFAVARFELTFAEWDACAAHGDCASRARFPIGTWCGSSPVFDILTAFASMSMAPSLPARTLSAAQHSEYAARFNNTSSFAQEISGLFSQNPWLSWWTRIT
jgi:formylglycine-generating enzyme required for sulfatase activity